MKNTIKLFLIVTVGLVIGISGCSNSTNSGPAEYTGGMVNVIGSSWVGNVQGFAVTISISNGFNWVLTVPKASWYDDSGTYIRGGSAGNIATLTSDYYKTVVGTATLTSENTMVVQLFSGDFAGSYSLIRN